MRNTLIIGAALFTVTFAGAAQAMNLTTFIQAGQAQTLTTPADDAALGHKSDTIVQPSSAHSRDFQALATGRSVQVPHTHGRLVH